MIEIRVVSRAGVAPDRPLAGRFGPAGGTIGRGTDCTLVLPDPERRMSRRQVDISWRSGGPVLRVVGAPLAVTLNGRAVEPQTDVPLNPGDELRLAGFVLAVAQVGLGERGTVPVRAEPEGSGATPRAPAWPPPAPPVPAVTPSTPPLPAPPPASALHRDSPPPAWLREGAGGAFDIPLPQGKPFPDDPELPSTSAYARPVEAPPVREVDLLIDTTGPSAASAGGVTGVAAGSGGAARPAASARFDAALPTPGAPAAAPLPSLTDADWLALYQGLGLSAPPPAADRRAQLRLIGGLLRQLLTGTLRLLGARTIAKRELGAGATMLQTRENNPLKFSPDVDVALGHLLGPTMGRAQPGFMPALSAVVEAYDDLQAHQMAVLAGTRAALDAVLSHFDPAALERRLAPRGRLDQWVPAKRRAELWAAYAAQHAEIVREATDDFDRLFGRAFLEAYEAQLAEFAGRSTGPRPDAR